MVEISLDIDLNVTPFHKTDDTKNEMNDDMVRELINQMSMENKKLKEMLTLVWDKNSSLQNHVDKLMQDHDLSVSNPNKRKFVECDECDTSRSAKSLHVESLKRPNDGVSVTRVTYRRTDPSDTSMIVKDGYHWRKYGQKVTRDNPSPRAYYKCSFAPTCPVKKKVQRSVDDECLLVAIYDGEHNHESTENEDEIQTSNRRFNSPMEFGKYEVEQMSDCLRRNPDFIQELANAISAKILENDLL